MTLMLYRAIFVEIHELFQEILRFESVTLFMKHPVHTEDAFRPTKAKEREICREIIMMQVVFLVGGGFSDVRTLEANGAPPEAFRGLSEDHFGFIAADVDRDPYEARKEDYLR